MKAQRILWLDILRILAAFMVVFIHSPKAIEGMESNIYYAMYNYIMLPCVPLFFIISGYLLLPTKENMFPFLKKRMTRIVFPLLFWSIIILIIGHHNSWKDFFQNLFYIPFFQKVNGHYWFLYSLISIYLVLPIVSAWLRTAEQRELEFALYLWLFVSALPFLNILLPNVFDGNGDYFNFLYYNAGFLGYFFLGYYLKSYKKKNMLLKSFVLMLITSGFHLFLMVYAKTRGEVSIILPIMNPYLSVDVIFQSLFIFLVVKKYGSKLSFMEGLIHSLALLTFGVYLIHGLILRYITFPLVYEQLNLLPAWAVPVCALITFILGLFIVFLISRLPKSKYIIG